MVVKLNNIYELDFFATLLNNQGKNERVNEFIPMNSKILVYYNGDLKYFDADAWCSDIASKYFKAVNAHGVGTLSGTGTCSGGPTGSYAISWTLKLNNIYLDKFNDNLTLAMINYLIDGAGNGWHSGSGSPINDREVEISVSPSDASGSTPTRFGSISYNGTTINRITFISDNSAVYWNLNFPPTSAPTLSFILDY